jgi:hypothetical protein
MLTTVEAEADVNGNVRLPEPVTITKTSRVIVTLLDAPPDAGERAASEAERARALENLMKYVGAVDSGDPNSADNEQID